MLEALAHLALAKRPYADSGLKREYQLKELNRIGAAATCVQRVDEFDVSIAQMIHNQRRVQLRNVRKTKFVGCASKIARTTSATASLVEGIETGREYQKSVGRR
jgi:hypothetical protein